MQRRQFLGAIGAIAGGAVWPSRQTIQAQPIPVMPAIENFPDSTAFWKAVRSQFLFPEGYIYLNTGGIGAVPAIVLQEVSNRMHGDQIHPRPGHEHKRWDEVKEQCAALLGAGVKKEEIALTGCATEGINIILNGLPLSEGDEIITSTHEHSALHVPLLNRMQHDGIVVRSFRPDFSDGLGNVSRIKKLISRRTKLIFISHVTCTTGQVFPIEAIAELARSRHIWLAVDGAQAGGAMPMSLSDRDIDLYAFSGHKWCLGPKRTGVLYVNENMLDTVRPTVVGAYSDAGYDIEKSELKLNPTAQRYEYATQNDALFHGLGVALKFIKRIGIRNIYNHNRQLAEMFYNGLLRIPGVKILSPQQNMYRSAIITFQLSNMTFRDAAHILIDEKDIRVRVVPEANVNGIRVSFHLYNSSEDVTRTLVEIEALAKA